jgi:hypothetical protein
MKRCSVFMYLGILALSAVTHAQAIPAPSQLASSPKQSVLYPPHFGILLTKEGWRVSLNQETFTSNGLPVPYLPYPAPPTGTFKTLADPALRQWIGQLPRWSWLMGSVILGPMHFGRGLDGQLIVLGKEGKISGEVSSQFSDLQIYCRSKDIHFIAITSVL